MRKRRKKGKAKEKMIKNAKRQFDQNIKFLEAGPAHLSTYSSAPSHMRKGAGGQTWRRMQKSRSSLKETQPLTRRQKKRKLRRKRRGSGRGRKERERERESDETGGGVRPTLVAMATTSRCWRSSGSQRGGESRAYRGKEEEEEKEKGRKKLPFIDSSHI